MFKLNSNRSCILIIIIIHTAKEMNILLIRICVTGVIHLVLQAAGIDMVTFELNSSRPCIVRS